jgi:hypothetical protein
MFCATIFICLPARNKYKIKDSKKVKKALPPPRFEIKKWNSIAMWSWDICADTVSLFWYLSISGQFLSLEV